MYLAECDSVFSDFIQNRPEKRDLVVRKLIGRIVSSRTMGKDAFTIKILESNRFANRFGGL